MTKKKTLLIIPFVIIMTVIISLATPVLVYANDNGYEPRLNAPSSSSPYYSRQLNRYFQVGSGMPNCVAYAYGRIYEMNGEKPLITHGSAGDWYFINKANVYYDYGSEPKLGAVACWSRHVAVVEKINENGSVTLSESHWGGRYFDTVTYSNMYSHYGQTFYGYIYTYNGGVTRALEKKLLNATNQNSDKYMTEKSMTHEVQNQFTLAKMDVESTTSEKEERIPVAMTLADKLNSNL